MCLSEIEIKFNGSGKCCSLLSFCINHLLIFFFLHRLSLPHLFQVLKNGVEVKLQRNALSVLEAPTGNEEDDDMDCDNSFCSSSDVGDKDMDYCKWTA